MRAPRQGVANAAPVATIHAVSPEPRTRRSSFRILPLALLLTACGGHHPLEGAWNQELPGGAHGIHLAFDLRSDKMLAGLAPRADNTHDDVHGTYTFDAAAGTVTMKIKLLGDGKADTWTGKIVGDDLEVSSADGKFTFARGAHAHGH